MSIRVLLGTLTAGVLVAVTASPAAAAGPASYDGSFGNAGVASLAPTPNTVPVTGHLAVDANGNVLVAAVATGPSSAALQLARFTSSGAPDSTFGTAGVVTTDLGTAGAVAGVAMTTGGILVAADAPPGTFEVLRYTNTGALDTAYGSGGKASVAGFGITAIAVDSHGDAIVTGRSPATQSGPLAFVERLTPAGTADSTFGTNGVVSLPTSQIATALAVLSDGHVLVGGAAGGRPTFWRLTSTGTLDTAYGSGGVSTLSAPGGPIESLTAASDGSAIAVEDRPVAAMVLRVTPSGAPDHAFGDGGGVELTTLGNSQGAGGAVDGAGNIVVAGLGGTTGLWMARLHPDGSLDRTFGPNGRVAVPPTSGGLFLPSSAPTLQTDGKILLAGASLTGTVDAPSASLATARLLGGTGTATPPVNTANRLAGDDRIGTAIAISQATFDAPDGTDQSKLVTTGVVLASAENYPDALVGTPLAASLGAPLLLSHTASLDAAVMTEIQRVLGPGSQGGGVTILGGALALSDAVQQSLVSAGYSVTRIAGATRFETAVDVANKLKATTVLEATGINFPDGVTAGAAAAHILGAVLLTNGSTQAAATAAYLQSSKPTAFAVGGAAAAADPSATPIVGADRWETAVKVASAFFLTPVGVGVATGGAFADALAGGSRAAEAGQPVILTDSATVPPVVTSYLTHNAPWIDNVDVFGGQLAVSDANVTAIKQAITESG